MENAELERSMRAAMQRAVQAAGGQTALARRIGKTQGHVSQWLRRGYVPPLLVPQIEQATGIPRHELRPDLFAVEDRGAA